MNCKEPQAFTDGVLSKHETKKRWGVVVLLFFGGFISYMDRANLSIGSVPIMQELNLSPGLMGALFSAFFWSYSLLQIPAGWLVDRYGYRGPYAIAFSLWCLASASLGLAQSFSEIVALRLLLGVGESVVGPATLAFIKHHFREHEQGLPTAIAISGLILGPACGALLGAAFLDRLGWRLFFILTGLAGCIWLVPWMLIVPRRAPSIIQDPKMDCVPPERNRPFRLRKFLLSRLVWGIILSFFFYSYYWYFCLTWLPSYLLMAHNLSYSIMGSVIAFSFVGMALASSCGGYIADKLISRFQRPLLIRKAFIVGGMTLAATILLLLHQKAAPLLFPILSVSLIGLGLAAGNYWSLTQLVSPAGWIGRIGGYQNMVGQLAGISAPVLTGLLIGGSNRFEVPIALAGISSLIAALSVVILIGYKKDIRSDYDLV